MNYIFIDIDGTLVNKKKEVSERTIKSLEYAKSLGHVLVICTGRPVNNIKELTCHNMFDYFIYANGTGIFDNKNDAVIFEKPMSRRDILKTYNKVDHVKVVAHFTSGDTQYKDADSTPRDKIATSNIVITAPETFISNNKILQTTYFSPDIEQMLEIKRMIESRKKISIKALSRHLQNQEIPLNQQSAFIDIAHKKCSKGYGIQKFCKMFKIKKERAIGIGDDFNDLTMFDAVGYKVAMGNSIKQVIDRADHVTKSNEEDGVAVYLESLSTS